RGVGGRRPELKQRVVNVGNECARFHRQLGKPPARLEASQSPTVPGMVHRLPMSHAALPLTLTLSLREREQLSTPWNFQRAVRPIGTGTIQSNPHKVRSS